MAPDLEEIEQRLMQLEPQDRAHLAHRLLESVDEIDITARKKLESQSLRAQRPESLEILAGRIAHDFNNILAPIVMGVSYLKRVETGEKARAVIENIDRSADRGTALIRQVLALARGAEVTRATLHVGDVIGEVESIVTSTFPKAIAVRTTIPAALPAIDGDAAQLNRVLLNLCANARDAMPDGGQLLIRAENAVIGEEEAALNADAAPGRYVKIDVIDEGCGVSPEIRDRIFEPFFTTKSGIGSGLGLSTALGIVRGHGGFIDLVSGTGKGASFSVYLPAGTQPASGQSPATEPPAVARANGELILIVDDEPSIVEIMQETLESYGYRVLVAEDGAVALELYSRHGDDISLVITDIVMPNMDGPALITELKRINAEVAIVIMSGLEGRSHETAGTAFLRKPFTSDQLLYLLQSVLQKAAG